MPQFYREVYQIVCPNQENRIEKEMFIKILVKSSLPKSSLTMVRLLPKSTSCSDVCSIRCKLGVHNACFFLEFIKELSLHCKIYELMRKPISTTQKCSVLTRARIQRKLSDCIQYLRNILLIQQPIITWKVYYFKRKNYLDKT